MAHRSETWSGSLIGLGALLLSLGALTSVLERSLFSASGFGARVSASLSDRGVAAYASRQITDGLQKANPDLIAARPLVLASTEAIVQSRAFGALVETAAAKAHAAMFSEGVRTVVLSLPDVEVLVRGALQQASPALAARIPKNINTVLAGLQHSKQLDVIVDLWRLGIQLRWMEAVLLTLGPLLLLAGLWIAPSRRRALIRCGIALCVAGLCLIAILPAGSLAATFLVSDPALRAAVQGLWRTFLSLLRDWGLFIAGFGILLCAGATSLLESVNPIESARRVLSFLVEPPSPPGWRLAWALALLLSGTTAIVFPREAIAAFTFVTGGLAAYAGIRELFRLILLRVDRLHVVESFSEEARWLLHAALIAFALVVLAGSWYWWRNPAARAVASTHAACNGIPELCRLRLDQVVFPASHNAMSNQEIDGWMFPHHERSMAGQLEAGIRALLFDVHYGLPGASRIKTDLSRGQNRDKILQALGKEGFDAAMRIRSRLVGVEEGNASPYLCHGFCELGAYELVPALETIREFLLQHPDEVLVFIIEDYITPADLAKAFQQSGLIAYVYRGAPRPQWLTLRELIDSGQRLVVFIESGRSGVPWLLPAFEHFQETPYSFHKVDEFSCVANRGGTAGSLFLMNNWVETTPTPRPSNAATVNARDFLVARARKCTAERGHIPNVIAVDFSGTGDVVGAVSILNREAVAGEPSPSN